MISKCELCFLFLFQNEYECGYMLKLIFLAHFTTLFRMVTKNFRKTDILSMASPGNGEIKVIPEPPSAVFSVCQNCYQKLVFCWHVFLTDTQISNS